MFIHRASTITCQGNRTSEVFMLCDVYLFSIKSFKVNVILSWYLLTISHAYSLSRIAVWTCSSRMSDTALPRAHHECFKKLLHFLLASTTTVILLTIALQSHNSKVNRDVFTPYLWNLKACTFVFSASNSSYITEPFSD